MRDAPEDGPMIVSLRAALGMRNSKVSNKNSKTLNSKTHGELQPVMIHLKMPNKILKRLNPRICLLKLFLKRCEKDALLEDSSKCSE